MIEICKYSPDSREDIFPSDNAVGSSVSEKVSAIINNVKENGDKALFEYARLFDGAELSSLEVTDKEKEEALLSVDKELLETIKICAENIRSFHKNQIKSGFVTTGINGEVLGQRILPLKRVGLYIPGGTASYPSTVLMNCIPAKLAGVGEIIMTTPVKSDLKVPAPILAAAHVAGVDRIFKSGGAQAIAALAYGTETVPEVDKIVGPGNVYVAEAKRQVFGKVGIDMIAGPSEILIIADEHASPEHIAADMLSQAEHDRIAKAVLVTVSEPLAVSVAAEVERQSESLPRADIARASVEAFGKIFIARDTDECIRISNLVAPEHLELCVADPFSLLGRIENAGSVFLGYHCPEALGDYFAGPNHTLPTSGTARFSSPLSVDDFVKRMSYTYYTKEALTEAAPHIERFASSEGLEAHARAVSVRVRKK